MCKQLDGFEIDEDLSIKVWRYIDIQKFESILKEKSMYFTSVEELDDKFEGAISDNDFKKIYGIDQADVEKVNLTSLKEKHRNTWMNEAFKSLRELTKINCWHINQHESAAMWKIYSNTDKGIAIQTTIQNLYSAFLEYKMKPEYGHEDIWIGKVKYIDYSNQNVGYSSLKRFFYKRMSFNYENELRILISLALASEFCPDIPLDGILVPVNMDKLIQSLYISPLVNNQDFIKDVEFLISKYGYTFPIKHSDLKEDPIY